MAKLIAVFLLFIASVGHAKSLQLELYAQTTLPAKGVSAKETVGGISGIFWDGSKVVAVSDDRGKLGSPRFYELELKLTPGKADLSVSKVHHFKGISPGRILDVEGVAAFSQGDLVMSSEGDNNKKPRAMPALFVTSASGDYKFDIPVPEKFLPEKTGLQKKGIENNRGFEGLTVDSSGQNIFIISEHPILTDQGSDDKDYWLRLVEFKKTKNSFKAVAEFPYKLNRAANSATGVEVFRGVSEILFVADRQFLVLERGARLSKTGISYSGGLYLTETVGAQDVSKIKNISIGNPIALKKERLIDFEELFKNQKVENFEGLAWGPPLPDGRKSLLVISDNNFSSKEKTTLLIFAMKEVE